MAHAYSNLFDIPCTGLRFFTVYGPWGRPDMAMFLFARAIMEGKPIELFNYGKMKRDFTYIEDVVEAMVKLIDKAPQKNNSWNASDPDPATSFCPYRIFNIGNNTPVEVGYVVELIEKNLGRKAEKALVPIQPGDVPATMANLDDLWEFINFKPSTKIEDGVRSVITWFKNYYKI